MTKSEQVAEETSVALAELEAAVVRLHEIEIDLDEVELALKEDREEVENYTNEIIDRCNRIEAIDKFVSDIQSGNVPDLVDERSMLSDMREERVEEESSIIVLSEARACHERQLKKLKTEHATLQTEKQVLHKKISMIRGVCGL